MSQRDDAALTAWEDACVSAHGGNAVTRPLITAGLLMAAGDELAAIVRDGPPPRLYGLTAEEWLHLAAEGEDSEVQPCCGNLGDLRELLNRLATCQSKDDTGLQLALGQQVLRNLEGDGDGHGLGSREQFPLLHRVLDGIRAQQEDPDPFGLGLRKEGGS